MDGLILLQRAQQAGLAVEAENGKLVIRGPKRAGSIAQLLIENKPVVLAALRPLPRSPDDGDAAWWRRQFVTRGIHWELSGYRSRREAEAVAFNELILAWYRRHGSHPDPRCCVGCGDELPDGAGLIVDRGGARAHFDGVRRIDCVIAFGRRWRGEAVAALRDLGVEPPPGFMLL